MAAQHQILRTLRAAPSQLARVMESFPEEGRTGISRRVCEAFGFRDAIGRVQHASCLRALKTLEGEGTLALPAPRRRVRGPVPRLLDAPLPKPVDVPASLKDVRGLEVELVEDAAQRALWNTLMDAEHPQGAAMFAGQQQRYLINSEHGYIAALGFAASALYLKARDAWMAWSESQREAWRHHVVGLNRFLIRPSVRCKNLASHTLAKVLRRLPQDFERRYGYKPWVVETFVGPDQRGTCFRAAGFVFVGHTTGRGRHAPTNACTKARKAVFVYDLGGGWRQQLGVPYVEAYPRLEVGAGLAGDTWAKQEFGGAVLGHKRRTDRLVHSVAKLSRTPGELITANMDGDRAAVQGFYRFLEKANEHGITPEKILAPHRQRTIERMRTQKVVLCIQDGTDIRYTTRPACKDLDVIGRNQTTSKAEGVHLHATIAMDEEGVPLGVLRCAYTPNKEAEHAPRTQLWIDGVQDVAEAASHLGGSTRVLCIMDREADVFAILEAQRSAGRADVLVRAKVNRSLGKKQPKLFARMREGSPAGYMEVPIARLSRRVKSGRVRHKGRTARVARMEVRYCRLPLPAPGHRKAAPVPVSAIHVREVQPPQGEAPVQWYLLTSLDITTLEEAVDVVGYYVLRWRVEDLFRVLKSGCQVERLGMRQAKSLHNAITIYMVMAWRLLLMTLLGREQPTASPENLFTDSELRLLHALSEEYELPPPTTLAAAIRIVAVFGGYMHRKNDPPPGPKIIWRGYSRLEIGAKVYAALARQYHFVRKETVKRE